MKMHWPTSQSVSGDDRHEAYAEEHAVLTDYALRNCRAARNWWGFLDNGQLLLPDQLPHRVAFVLVLHPTQAEQQLKGVVPRAHAGITSGRRAVGVNPGSAVSGGVMLRTDCVRPGAPPLAGSIFLLPDSVGRLR